VSAKEKDGRRRRRRRIFFIGKKGLIFVFLTPVIVEFDYPSPPEENNHTPSEKRKENRVKQPIGKVGIIVGKINRIRTYISEHSTGRKSPSIGLRSRQSDSKIDRRNGTIKPCYRAGTGSGKGTIPERIGRSEGRSEEEDEKENFFHFGKLKKILAGFLKAGSGK
jgi:hypothetical protein